MGEISLSFESSDFNSCRINYYIALEHGTFDEWDIDCTGCDSYYFDGDSTGTLITFFSNNSQENNIIINASVEWETKEKDPETGAETVVTHRDSASNNITIFLQPENFTYRVEEGQFIGEANKGFSGTLKADIIKNDFANYIKEYNQWKNQNYYSKPAFEGVEKGQVITAQIYNNIVNIINNIFNINIREVEKGDMITARAWNEIFEAGNSGG